MATERKGTIKLVGFSEALTHMRDGMPAVRVSWQRDRIRECRLIDSGLQQGDEFVQVNGQNQSTRYQMSTADLLADDWRLL